VRHPVKAKKESFTGEQRGGVWGILCCGEKRGGKLKINIKWGSGKNLWEGIRRVETPTRKRKNPESEERAEKRPRIIGGVAHEGKYRGGVSQSRGDN